MISYNACLSVCLSAVPSRSILPSFSLKCILLCLQCRRPRFNSWVRKISWRWKWQPTSVFLPGEFHGQRDLVDYSPWDCKESYTTEWLTHTHTHTQFLCFYLLCYLSLLAFFTWTTITTSTLISSVIAAPFFTLCLPGWSFWGPHITTDLLGLILTHSPSLSSG